MICREEVVSLNNVINIEIIAIVVLSALCIGVIIIAVKKRHDIIAFFNREDIRNRIKQLIILAEKEFHDKTGQEKLWKVCSYIWSFIPPSMKPFISVDMLVGIVNLIFDEIAEYIDGHRVPIYK